MAEATREDIVIKLDQIDTALEAPDADKAAILRARTPIRCISPSACRPSASATAPDRAMPFTARYASSEPTPAEIDALTGDTLLEFGAPWCGHCIAAQPAIEAALARRDVRHLKIEDGRGKPLGRSFRVKLWPTWCCCATASNARVRCVPRP